MARDAVDQATEIVRDAVSLGMLQARHRWEDLGPRLAWGSVAVLCGAIGAILGVIALFMGLGVLIPSVGVRLAIFAALFLGASGLFAYRASRRRRLEPKRFEEPPRVVPFRPIEGVGE